MRMNIHRLILDMYVNVDFMCQYCMEINQSINLNEGFNNSALIKTIIYLHEIHQDKRILLKF